MEYISTTETAKLIRKALKESFPGYKFSVRSDKYAGGSSIDVTWTDGPNRKLVEHVINIFAGSYFDGMTDYKGNKYHMFDGKRTSFGPDFVFAHREYSDEYIKRAIDTTYLKWQHNYEAAGINKPNVEDYRSGKLMNITDPARHFYGGQDVQQDIREVMSKKSQVAKLEKSETLDRIHFLGDDGYGTNSVGKNAAIRAVQ